MSFSYLEPVCCPMFSFNCCFLTWIQVSQEVCPVVWYSHFFQNFPQFIVIHRVKGFGIVNKAEIDVFLELSCFLDNPADVGNLISGSFAFSETRLNIWKFTVHIILKPGLENFEHYFTSVWDECNCAVVWAFFGIAFLWNWNESIVWPQVNNREGIQLRPSTENWIKGLLSMVLPTRTRLSFCLSQSFPTGSFHKPLILLHQRADRLKITITEN